MTPPKEISRFELLAVLRKQIAKDGSQAATARGFGCSGAYLSDVLKGKRDPGPKILAPLGYTVKSPAELRYRKVG